MGISNSIVSHGKVVSKKDLHRINVLFICEEWKSAKGGLPTLNRESAIYLAKTSNDKIKVHCYVSQSDDSDREDARKNGVNIITAQSIPGTRESLEWLRLPPPELSHPDIVIGHGRKFGTPAYCIVQTTNCKWVQFVHVFCEDLGKYKQMDANRNSVSDAIEENEKHKEEIELCKAANVVVAVGSRLQLKYSKCLPGTEVHVITPGILDKFTNISDQKLDKVTHSPEFSVFVFGRGTYEDLALKGYDIIANAVGSLGEEFKMTFVGSPEGQHRNLEWFLDKTKITRKQVTIRGYCDQDELKMMFHEADLVAMPSRTEGFGLVALEAISAGVPVLITSESGIAKALEKVEGGKSVIVESEDPKEWSQKIRLLSEQKPEERHNTAIDLRENYKRTFSWETQCEKFKEMILGMMEESTCPAEHHDDGCSVSPTHINSEKPVTDAGEASDYANENSPANSENEDLQMLHSAAKNGNIEIIQTILSTGFKIDSRNSNGETPLMIAAANDKPSKKPSAFHLLLQKGAAPSLKNNDGWSLLHCAAQGGNTSIIDKLLSLGLDIDSRNSDGDTPLMIAAVNDKPSAFHLLLQKGAAPSLKNNDGWSLLHCATEGGNTSIIDELLSLGLDIDSRNSYGSTPLMIAARNDKPSAFHHLLQKGAASSLKNNDGWSLLHYAARGGNTSIVDKLLSLGLDIDSRNSDGETTLMIAAANDKPSAFHHLLQKGAASSLKDNDGQSLLHDAAQGGNTSIIHKLLSLGLDIDSRNSDGSTPLMVAAANDKPSAFHHLLQKGAAPSLKDNDGWSLLHYAAQGENTSIIDKLLSLGLDIDSRNSYGSTPLMIATNKQKFEAVRYLVSKGAH